MPAGGRCKQRRVRAFAQRILKDHGLSRDPSLAHTPDDQRIAQILADYLTDHFTYTLDNPTIRGKQDPVVQFLLNRQKGHCELFASAHAAMCRSLGIPARDHGLPCGKLQRTHRLLHRATTLRARMDGSGLRPNHRVASVRSFPCRVERHVGFMQTMRDLHEYLEITWTGSIAAYDQQTRDALLHQGKQRIVQPVQTAYASALTGISALPSTALRRPSALLYIMGGSFLTVGLIGGIATRLRQFIRRRRCIAALRLEALPHAEQCRLSRQLCFYLDMLHMLERRGHHRPTWQTPRAFATKLAHTNPQCLTPVAALTDIVYEVRFGRRTLDQERKQRVDAYLKHLAHAPGKEAMR